MPIISILFLALLTVPVIEIYLLIQVGSVIGAFNTILVVIATAILGAFLLRREGLSTLARARAAMDRNELPATELIEGIILLVTGALLLTPGFFTDAIGFLCLLPMTRQLLAKKLLSHFVVVSAGRNDQASQPQQRESTTLEGEFWKEDEKSDRK